MSLSPLGSIQLSDSSSYGGSADSLDGSIDSHNKTVRYAGQPMKVGGGRVRTDSSASSMPNQQNGQAATGDVFFSSRVGKDDDGFVSLSNLTDGVKKLISVAQQVASHAVVDELSAAIENIASDDNRLHSDVNIEERPFGVLQDIAESITTLLEDESISDEVKLIAVKQLASNKSEFAVSSSYRAMHTLLAEKSKILEATQATKIATVKEIANALVEKNPSMLRRPEQNDTVALSTDASVQELVDLVAEDIGVEASEKPECQTLGQTAALNIDQGVLTDFYQTVHVMTTPAMVYQRMSSELKAQLLTHTAQTQLTQTEVSEYDGLQKAICQYELLTGKKVFSESNQKINVQNLHDSVATDVARFMSTSLSGIPVGENESVSETSYRNWGQRPMDKIMTVGGFQYSVDVDDDDDDEQKLTPITIKYLEKCDLNNDLDSPMLVVTLQAINQTSDWDELLTFEKRIQQDGSKVTTLPKSIKTLLLQQIEKQLVVIGQRVSLSDFIENDASKANIVQIAARVDNAGHAVKVMSRAYKVSANPSEVVNAIPAEFVNALQANYIKTLDSSIQRVLVQFAINNGEEALMTELLSPQVGLNVNLKLHATGFTPLYLAVKLNQRGIVNQLLNVKERIDMVEEYHNQPNTLYHLCVLEKHNELLQQLIVQHVIDPNVVVERFGDKQLHCPAIYLAAQEGNTAAVKTLLKEVGIDVKLKNEDGYTALHAAAKNGHHDIVVLLLPLWTRQEVKDMDSEDVPSPSQLAGEFPQVAKLVNDRKPTIFSMNSDKPAKATHKGAFASQASSHDYESMSLWSRNKHVYTSIKTCDPAFTKKLLAADADVLWKQDNDSDTAFDTLIVWGGYIPLAKKNTFDTGVLSTTGNKDLAREDKVRLKEVGDAIFAKLPNSDDGTTLKFEHFSHLMEKLSKETVSALFVSIMNSAKSFEELMSINEELKKFTESNKYSTLQEAFYRHAQHFLTENRDNRTSMIEHIKHSNDPISLRKFLTISNDGKITLEIFKRLAQLEQLEQEDFTVNCPLDHMHKLGSTFLIYHCTALPNVLERVIKEDHSTALEVMLQTGVSLDDALPSSELKPLEMACMIGCTHSVTVLIAKLSDQLKGTDRPGILLGMSAQRGHVDIMRELMWNFDIDPQKAVVVNRLQISPIQCAVKANRLESAKLLFAEAFLDTSANAVSQATEDNPIHQAIMHRNQAMLTLLCSKHKISLSKIKLHSSVSEAQVIVQQLTKEAIDKHETIKGRFVDTVTEEGKSFRNVVGLLSKNEPRIEESLGSEYADAAKLPVENYCDDTLDVKDYSLRVRNQMLVKAIEAENNDAITKLNTAGAYAA